MFHRIHGGTRLAGAAGALCVLLAAGACKDPTGSQPGGITVVSGASVSDSATARLPQPLVVEVRDSTGRRQPGVTVRFEASTATLRGVQQATVLVSSSTPDVFLAGAEATTDANGRAAVRVQLGRVATNAVLHLSVPTLGLAGTATYTVTPGAAVRTTVAPQDTAVYAGASYALRAASEDRWGNAIASAGATAVSDAPAVATATGTTVAGQAVGRARVMVTIGGASTPVFVSVVPRGTLLASAGDGIYTFNLDGSGFRRVVTLQAARSPRWFPNGQSFVFSTGLSHAWVSDLNGTTRPLVQGANPLAAELWAHPSRDGQWVYFGGYDPNYRGYPYRVRADGTGLQLVPGFTADDRTQSHPSPSPDGTRVAYFHEAPGDSRNVTLRILNMHTGQLQLQDVAGHSPEWSHGDSIAYLDMQGGTSGPIRLMSATGGGRRLVALGAYDFGMDWSPDDQWIAATNVATRQLELVRVSTGLRLPLPYTTGLDDPAWKP